MQLASLTPDEIATLADSPRIFQRGAAYYQAGAIQQLAVLAQTITARVRGRYGDYSVTIEETPLGLQLACDCPYPGRGCKHLVAVLLRFVAGEPETISHYEPTVPVTLAAALTALPHEDLLALVLQLVAQRADFRREFGHAVQLSAARLCQQPRDPQQVAQLQTVISDYFRACRWRLTYDDVFDDDEGQSGLGLLPVFDAARLLHPADQVAVYWAILSCARECHQSGQLGPLAPLQKACAGYAEAVRALDLTPSAKQPYLASLLMALNWDLGSWPAVRQALNRALDALASTTDDYRYLITGLAQSSHPQALDWLAAYQLCLGDDEAYLPVRQSNLKTPAQFLDLAQYWRAKGEVSKYAATLEQWLTVSLRPDNDFDLGAAPDREAERRLLAELAAHYRARGEAESYSRILLIAAEQGGLSLDLYEQIKSVATELGTWPQTRLTVLALAAATPLLLARIHLAEADWPAVLELAESKGITAQVQALIADELKQARPAEAIKIYQSLIQRYIGLKDRAHYRLVWDYFDRIRQLYLTSLRDKAGWQNYVKSLRRRYPRHPVFQKDFTPESLKLPAEIKPEGASWLPPLLGQGEKSKRK